MSDDLYGDICVHPGKQHNSTETKSLFISSFCDCAVEEQKMLVRSSVCVVVAMLILHNYMKNVQPSRCA